ncbi:MAG: hypothetical protein A2Y38_06560 [Spirochaetes bacterium GWB1_59_5]|nr:MAG: hypothetical protein A2Y38_06560 [Spirochaetes bacterium GWB1_59_5]
MTDPSNPYNRTDIAPGRWVVLCREDRCEVGPGLYEPGPYVLATSSGFYTEQDARHYAAGISPSREPLVAQIPA